MNFSDSVINIIKKRKSVRTFSDVSIKIEIVSKIKKYINNKENLIGPIGKEAKIELIPINYNTSEKGIKLGTYGIIKKPKAYLVGIIENNNLSLVEFGYVFEKLILFLTDLNLGTCWLGGTFTRNSFEKEIKMNNTDLIPAITPIGYEKNKRSLIESAMRAIVKADNRKPWDEIFFYSDFKTTLSKEVASKLAHPFEMIRLGPSASNKQPWRVVLSEDKNTVHFYLQQTEKYIGNKLGYEIQRIDIGIAMCHFELTCRELNINGNWIIKEPEKFLDNKSKEYIISYNIKHNEKGE